MSLYGVMRTSTSGMAAQSNRIATVAENVANVNTDGYKRSSARFSSLLIDSACTCSYNSGAVETNVRTGVGAQGSLIPTDSVTDLAVSGDGFFVVADEMGTPCLTRAGAFVANGDGDLINAAGFHLLGYPLNGTDPDVTVNGYAGLVPVSLAELALTATPSTSGMFTANLPAEAAVVAAGALPSANAATAHYTAKSSLVVYGNLGETKTLDLFYAKTGDNTWELSVYDRAGLPASGEFPYASGALVTSTLTFDDGTGQLAAGGPDSVSIPVPDGAALVLDLAQMSQLATGYMVLGAQVNGNAASSADIVEIARDGTVYAAYDNGDRRAVYRIPLASVASPDNLDQQSGNVFVTTSESGPVRLGFAQEGGRGDIVSGSLEQSTVDLATELTDMIDAQRGYTANSKVFQTGAELMDVLVNLKR